MPGRHCAGPRGSAGRAPSRSSCGLRGTRHPGPDAVRVQWRPSGHTRGPRVTAHRHGRAVNGWRASRVGFPTRAGPDRARPDRAGSTGRASVELRRPTGESHCEGNRVVHHATIRRTPCHVRAATTKHLRSPPAGGPRMRSSLSPPWIRDLRQSGQQVDGAVGRHHSPSVTGNLDPSHTTASDLHLPGRTLRRPCQAEGRPCKLRDDLPESPLRPSGGRSAEPRRDVRDVAQPG